MIPLFVTLVSALVLSLEYGILIGLATNMAFLLYASARPPLTIEKSRIHSRDVFVVTPSRSLQYPAAEFIRERVMKECNQEKNVIVIDGKYIRNIDSTVAKNIQTLAEDIRIRQQTLILTNFKQSVKDICVKTDGKLAPLFEEQPLEEVLTHRF